MKGLSYHPAALALALTLTLLAAETSALNFGRESGIALTKRYDASAQCGDLSGNSDRIWGIDYNRFNARPYVRFVLAQSDGKDQGDRMGEYRRGSCEIVVVVVHSTDAGYLCLRWEQLSIYPM